MAPPTEAAFLLTLPQWLSVLAMLSVISAAGFGLLALFTNYKHDGKVTRYGRWSVIGILVAASCSIATRVIQDRLDAKRSADAAAAEANRQAQEGRRFAEQVRGLSRLQEQMRTSLDEQNRQRTLQQAALRSAEAALRETQSLSSQEEGNTQRVVLAMWRETNRVAGSSIVARVRTRCLIYNRSDIPELIPPNANVSLVIRNQQGAFGVFEPTNRQDTSISWSEGENTQVNMFSEFAGSFGGIDERFNDITNWRGTTVDFLISVQHPGIAAIYWGAALPRPGQSLARARTEGRGATIALPCTTFLNLLVNNRVVVRHSGRVVELGPEAIDAGMLVLSFATLSVPDDAIPLLPGLGRRGTSRGRDTH